MRQPYNPLHTVVKEGLLRVWPDECLVCHREDAWICTNCQNQCITINSPTCPFCNRLSDTGRTCRKCRSTYALNGCRSLWYYRPPLTTVITGFKYRGFTAATEELAKPLATLISSLPVYIDLITSVPSLPSKERERGFNQSELLAKAVSCETTIPYIPLLTRVPSLHGQVGLSRSERFKNVANQFHCKRQLEGQSILVIDDVITTGATLNACAQALKAAESGPVWAITLGKD